jgi:hypothetical protein
MLCFKHITKLQSYRSKYKSTVSIRLLIRVCSIWHVVRWHQITQMVKYMKKIEICFICDKKYYVPEQVSS